MSGDGGDAAEAASAAGAPRRASRGVGVAVAIAALALAAAHQDFWLWTDPTLVLGFFPIGLLYHALYSVVAATFWSVAMRIAWPTTVMDEVPDTSGAAAAAEAGAGGGSEP